MNTPAALSHFAPLLGTALLLGAGLILRESMNVRGLNTAAALWGTAAVGAGLPRHAALITAAILAVNLCMRPVVAMMSRLGGRFGTGSPTSYVIELTMPSDAQLEIRGRLVEAFDHGRLGLRGLETRGADADSGIATITADVIAYGSGERAVEQVISQIGRLPSISSARWSRKEAVEADPRLHLGS